MKDNHDGTTLERFFRGLSECVFQTQLGIADPPLTDYVSNLLVRFVKWEAVYRVRNLGGKPLKYVGDMLDEADARLGEAKRDVHRHIGDFTLFWAGVYPEALRGRRGRSAADQYGDYCVHGKLAYRIAASIEVEQSEDAPSEVLERLSSEFEMCAYGLREVRREWEQMDDGAPGLLWTQ